MKPPIDIAADLDTPVSAYLKLKPFRPRFLLESVEGGERLELDEGDYLAIPPHARHRVDETGPATIWLVVHLTDGA